MSTNSLSTVLSGISAANERLRASANNIANLNTEGYRRERVEAQTTDSGGVSTTVTKLPTPGQDLATDVVDQQAAAYTFIANLKVLQTQVRAEGALLDIRV
ncbi:flagellar basal body protein [Roseateles depolymerans]|uniref:Flagellar basal body rod protein n=1 Tax=Roseateles depolymerans TaxID=76731 RepID=A0A0U3LQI9_9BURK|nr:flagellar basal body protein [Roseateles depolymerans]ALV07239.1 Flagellar basal body rod protein [Roseateles depolymerans]REG20222.1 flagellar basal-body rod protein FlgC [Roseateles depolymerans]